MAENVEADAAADETPEQVETTAKTVTEAAEDATGTVRSEQEEQQRRRAQRQVQDAFAACVRCGYFLSDYRMLHGTEHFADVVGTSGRGWLELTWAPALRRLLEKSYGLRLDANVEQFKGTCGTCGRTFVLQRQAPGAAVAEADPPAERPLDMRIQIRPRGSADVS